MKCPGARFGLLICIAPAIVYAVEPCFGGLCDPSARQHSRLANAPRLLAADTPDDALAEPPRPLKRRRCVCNKPITTNNARKVQPAYEVRQENREQECSRR